MFAAAFYQVNVWRPQYGLKCCSPVLFQQRHMVA